MTLRRSRELFRGAVTSLPVAVMPHADADGLFAPPSPVLRLRSIWTEAREVPSPPPKSDGNSGRVTCRRRLGPAFEGIGRGGGPKVVRARKLRDLLFEGRWPVLHLRGVQIASEKRRNPWTTAGSGYRIRRVLRLRRRQIMGHTRARL
jgi:hypothetical protein